ncbi:MAG: phenylalanine--tRNA ligase subunit beta, partial [Ruminococcus sp.]|nr:phenylalanine--tRNA ligase subunit beta [Ruminococcus sp.]
LPKFPASVRDLSVVCDSATPVADIEKAVKKAVGGILESVSLFDVYTGAQVGDGKKSVSYSITMRSHEGTLTDEQTDKAMDKVFKALSDNGWTLRE